MKRNMRKIIDSTEVNIFYDMSQLEMMELYRSVKSKDSMFSALFDAFRYGYAMGMRAEKSKKNKSRS